MMMSNQSMIKNMQFNYNANQMLLSKHLSTESKDNKGQFLNKIEKNKPRSMFNGNM